MKGVDEIFFLYSYFVGHTEVWSSCSKASHGVVWIPGWCMPLSFAAFV